jgi:hypothetical protein
MSISVPPPVRPFAIVRSDDDIIFSVSTKSVHVMDSADALCGLPTASSRTELSVVRALLRHSKILHDFLLCSSCTSVLFLQNDESIVTAMPSPRLMASGNSCLLALVTESRCTLWRRVSDGTAYLTGWTQCQTVCTASQKLKLGSDDGIEVVTPSKFASVSVVWLSLSDDASSAMLCLASAAFGIGFWLVSTVSSDAPVIVTFVGHLSPEKLDKPLTALTGRDCVLLAGHSDGSVGVWKIQHDPFSCTLLAAAGLADGRKVDAIGCNSDVVCIAASSRLSVFKWTPDDGTIDDVSGVHVLNAHCSGVSGIGLTKPPSDG